MKRFTQHQANCGARLAGRQIIPIAREPSSQAPPGSRATPDADAPPASGEIFELTLSDTVQAILLLACRAAGASPGDFVARAICAYAQEAVGFPALCDELHAAPDPTRIGESRFSHFSRDGPDHRAPP